MTQTHEQSNLTVIRPQPPLAWKPIQCRSSQSRFDEMEANLLRSAAGGDQAIEGRQVPIRGGSNDPDAAKTSP